MHQYKETETDFELHVALVNAIHQSFYVNDFLPKILASFDSVLNKPRLHLILVKLYLTLKKTGLSA